ncbi:MAG: methylenetetrahydrofolate reductase [NAD(P)H] [Acidobacteriota bacterium]
MSLRSIYTSGTLALSFELFPPKTAEGEVALHTHVERLMAFTPRFVTCTYGAGGSTRERTLAIVEEVKRRFRVPVASHLTCVGSTVDDLRSYLADARTRGVDFIVALRGDPPHGQATFAPVAGGLTYANELVGLIRQGAPEFGIAVAGYPETHREAPSLEADLENLKRKVDAGADVVLTQLFYRNDDFFRFRDRCAAIGITVPIVPGILPVTNLAQVQRIASLCGAHLPATLTDDLARHAGPDDQFQAGVAFAIRQVQELLDSGVPGIHFYVLNKSQATTAVLEAVRASAAQETGS